MSGKTNLNNHQQNEIIVAQPEEGAFINLNEIIRKAPDGTIMRLESGVYQIKETITLNKSVKLVGNGMDNTFLTGNGLDLLLKSKGHHHIELEGISFIINSEMPTNGVRIEGGSLIVENSFFTGSVIDREGQQGIGLHVIGDTDLEIRGCRFETNENAGIWADDHVQGKVIKNTFNNNESGLVVVGSAVIDAVENTFTHNHVSLAYDLSAQGSVEKNVFKENRGGVLIKGDASPSILNNTFTQNDGAAGFFENCEVLFEGNEISDGDRSLVVGHTAKAIVKKNRIEKNDQGIVCVNQSNTQILENTILYHDKFGILVQDESTTNIVSNVINENTAGIKFDNQAKFSAVDNQIMHNFYGVLATGYAQGKLHRNIIEKNNRDPMGWNVDVREAAEVDFDDYKESQPEGMPVGYSLQKDQYIVSPSTSGDKVSFAGIITCIQPGQEIILEEGEFQLSEPILIDKPICLSAKAPGKVVIKGEEHTNLLVYQGNGELTIKEISFFLTSSEQTNVVMVKSGHLTMDQCIIEGASDHKANKRDFGAGLLLVGKATALISSSIFKNNLLGMSVQEDASVTLHSNRFSENSGYGIVFRDRSRGSLNKNEYKSNKAYGLMAYEESQIKITNDKSHQNGAGFGFINQTQGTIEGSESCDNESHGVFIDNEAICVIKNCHIHSNEMSGVAIFGDNQSELEGNEICYNGHSGIESAESAQTMIKANNLHANSFGIFLGDEAHSTMLNNAIHENETGIKVQDDATAVINNNRIFSNAEGGIIDWSSSDLQISENEVFDNGEPTKDEDEGSLNYGDFLADLLGSENLSNDPHIAAIPITDAMLNLEGTQDEGDEDDQINLEEEGVLSDGYYRFQILFFEDGELCANVFQIKVDPGTPREWLEQEVMKIREVFEKEHPNAEIY